MDRAAAQSARGIWQALLRSVRNGHFYDLDHPNVQRSIEELRRSCTAALQVQPVIVFDLDPPRVLCGEHPIYDGSADNPELGAALVRQGVRAIALRHAPEYAACARVVELCALYDGMEAAPAQPLHEVLQWEPLPGWVFEVTAPQGSSPRAPAATMPGRDFLEELLEHGHGVELPLAVDAVRSVWDLRGGQLRWPPKFQGEELEGLASETRMANQRGVPTSRVGMLLGQAVSAWAHGPRGAELVSSLPSQVERLLAVHRVGEIPRLLSPLFQWASKEPTDAWARRVQDQILGLVPMLLAPERMELLLDGVRTGMVTPPELGAYLSALPAHALGEVFVLAARLEPGPHRDTIEEAARRTVARNPEALLHAASTGPPGIAVRALEIALALPEYPHMLRLGLVCLGSSEPAVRRAAVRVLAREPSRSVAARFLRHLDDEDPTVRAVAVNYLGRYKFDEAWGPLRAATESRNFHLLDLEERFRICTALGQIGGDQALGLCRKALRNWEGVDPDRAGPWLRCLVAMSTEAGLRELRSLVRRAPDQVRDIAELTLEEAELAAAASEPSRPPLQTRPGQYSPGGPSEPGVAAPDGSGMLFDQSFDATGDDFAPPPPPPPPAAPPRRQTASGKTVAPPSPGRSRRPAGGPAPPSRRHSWASDQNRPDAAPAPAPEPPAEPPPVDGNALLWGDD